MRDKQKSKQPSLILGALPVEKINQALNMELAPGHVVFSRAAQIHAARRHADDYPKCLPHAASIILNPLYIGDDFRNDGIELIGSAPVESGFILIAVHLDWDESHQYHVKSIYPVSRSKIEGRRHRGFLKVVI